MDELVVAHVNQSRGQKSDALDALAWSEELRTGAIKCPVFKSPGQFSRLREPARVLQPAPGMGPIRVACLQPIVVTPHRFRTRRQFRSCCGLGIVMRSSSDWVPTAAAGWARGQVLQTRGLNRRHDSKLKDIFKGAATTVITMLPNDPLHEHYRRLTAAGTKPNLAKVTIARRIAAIVLRTCKDGRDYDPKALAAMAQEDLASPPN